MVREWLIYVAIMLVLLVVMFRDRSLVGITAGLLVSGPLYLGFGYVLAKFGYRRKSWKELREESPGDSADESRDRSSKPAGPRPKPAPTSRTGGGSTRPGGARRRR
jgi:uncharacterized membrane protein